MQNFVALQQDGEFDLHPVLHRRLRARSPICIVGPAFESKAAETKLSGSECCDCRKWPMISRTLAMRMLTINRKKFKLLSRSEKARCEDA